MGSRPTQRFVKGQTILEEGNEGDRTFKILSGEVVVCKENTKGNLVPIARLGPGEVFGEMYLFEGTAARNATVVAASASDVVVEVYFEHEMQHLISEMNPAMYAILRGYNMRLKHATQQVAELTEAPAVGRQVSRLPDGLIKQTGTTIRPRN